jgi:hypothetical protein
LSNFFTIYMYSQIFHLSSHLSHKVFINSLILKIHFENLIPTKVYYALKKKYIDVWKGVALDSQKFHPGPPCPTLLRPAVGPCKSASRLARINGVSV